MRTKLSKKEIQVLKLKDLENLSDEDCCEKIDLNFIEYEDLLIRTRRKIVNSVLDNKKIIYDKYDLYDLEDEIEDELNICFFRCAVCGTLYKINYTSDSIICPLCNSSEVMEYE